MAETIEKFGTKVNESDCVFDIFADEWGPEKIVYIYEPRCGLRGIVVIDNSSIGPAIGGIRMTPTVPDS